jgi:hypothetical protein
MFLLKRTTEPAGPMRDRLRKLKLAPPDQFLDVAIGAVAVCRRVASTA